MFIAVKNWFMIQLLSINWTADNGQGTCWFIDDTGY